MKCFDEYQLAQQRLATVARLHVATDYQIVLAKEGAIPLLVGLLERGTHRGREEAAVALANDLPPNPNSNANPHRKAA